MSQPNEYVPARDLKAGDRILYAGVVVTVHRVTAANWREGGEIRYGTEVECRDQGGSARLCLYRACGHEFEVIR